MIESSAPINSMLRTTAQSFDMFDTLIARRCVSPEALFAEVGATCGRRDFPAARIAAERLCGKDGDFGIDTIYGRLQAIEYCDAATAARLKNAEVEAEFDNAIPIQCNIAAVRDFDLVISDMYLSAHILRSLLQHVGLRRPIYLFASNAGKRNGSIWKALSDGWVLRRHIGDNLESDVMVPQGLGIPSEHYVASKMTEIERVLDDAGLQTLARLSRQARLANPYPTASLESMLWTHFVEFNFPLLCLAATDLLRRRLAGGYEKLLLVERDCHFLSEVIRILRADAPIESIQVSRRVITESPATIAAYLDGVGLGRALVCDLVSTGYSWLRLAHTAGIKIAFHTLVFVDDYPYAEFDYQDAANACDFALSYSLLSSQTKYVGKSIEVLNTAPNGTVTSLDACGDLLVPRFARHELAPSLVNALMSAQGFAASQLRVRRDAIRDEISAFSSLEGLMAALVRGLSAPHWINHVAQHV